MRRIRVLPLVTIFFVLFFLAGCGGGGGSSSGGNSGGDVGDGGSGGGSTPASAFESSIRVSGGGAYDYFVIGMKENATNGFDNAYDTIAPAGNLNNTYISSYISHPEWGVVKDDFRADIRSVNNTGDWMVTVETNLSAGTPLTMAIQGGDSANSIIVEDMETGQVTDLRTSSYTFNVSNNSLRQFKVTLQ